MIRAAVVTNSDKGYRGEREDASGPLLCQLLAEMGAQVVATHLIPDEPDQITALLTSLADGDGVDLVLTTGGTGPSPRDLKPGHELLLVHGPIGDRRLDICRLWPTITGGGTLCCGLKPSLRKVEVEP